MSSPAPTSPPAPPTPVPTSPPSPDNTTIPPPPIEISNPNSPPNPPRPSNNTPLIALGVGVGLGGTIVLIAVGIFVLWYKRRKTRLASQLPKVGSGFLPKPTPPPGVASNPHLYSVDPTTLPPPSVTSTLSSKNPSPKPSPRFGFDFSKGTFTYEELELATDGFSNSNLLGQGGFGYVHKGVLPNGKEVAIKQLKVGSGQGEREFQAEVDIISRVHHKHLVSLVGYCSSGAKRLLVYEFVANNTLEFHLHGEGQPPMNWDTRMKIALGSAKGLAYLHEDCQPKIIHRDIKAANILLDNNFEAKVADFGLARINSDADTHISTRVMGTFGYLAPEYALSGKLTDKSDVFSFGVMLLELITGRPPIDKGQFFVDDNIVDWARPLLAQALENGHFDTLVDQRLQKNYNSTEMVRMVACAAVCVCHFARRRPRMSQVVRALEGNMSLDELNEGVRPGHSSIYGSHESSHRGNAQYKEDLIKFRKMALETQEHISCESSGPITTTSEFGQHPSGSSTESQQTQSTKKDGDGEISKILGES